MTLPAILMGTFISGCLGEDSGAIPNGTENATDEVQLDDELEQKWMVDLKGDVVPRPAGTTAIGDLVYVATKVEREEWPHPGTAPAKGAVTALDIADGSREWQREFPVPLGAVASDGQRLYVCRGSVPLMPVGFREGDSSVTESENDARRQLNDMALSLSAHDPATGDQQWSDEATESRPPLHTMSDVVTVWQGDTSGADVWGVGALQGHDVTDGSVRWTADTPLSYHSTVTDGTVVVTDTKPAKRVVGYDLGSGERRWQLSIEVEPSVSTPASPTKRIRDVASASDVVYLDINNAGIWCLDGQTGETRWRYTERGWSSSTVRATENVAVATLTWGSGSEDEVVAIEAATGDKLWSQALDVHGRLLSIAGDTVAAVTSDDSLVRLEAATGEPRGRYQTGIAVAQPLLHADGSIIVPYGDGRVTALM